MSNLLRFTKIRGAVRYSGMGSVVLVKRGDQINPDELMDGELDRLLAVGAVCTEADWNAGERVPHHKRPPHRGQHTLRQERPAAPVVEETEDAAADADADATDEGSDELSDEALAAMWQDGKTPKVSELVELVGDDPVLAARVLAAEKDGTGGAPRTTLESKLEAVIKAAEGSE